MKIVVGVSTYGDIPRANGLFNSFKQFPPSAKHEISYLLVDDGTPNQASVRLREKFCRENGIDFIAHQKNQGISGAWNTILRYAADKQVDFCVISNDDIRSLVSNSLDYMAYFFEKNENIASVGLALVNDPEVFDESLERWNGNPGRCGAAVGCYFGIKPELALSVTNMDGSEGFWLDTRSFHEETHMGFSLAQRGYLSYMLPYPVMRHQGGATFQANPQLVWREPSPYLPLPEFLHWARQSRWFVPQYEQIYAKNQYDRMTASRILFCKAWGILDEVAAGRRYQDIKDEKGVDILDEPSKFVHVRTVDIHPPRQIFWLGKDGQEHSYMDA